jgi:integrase
MATKQKQRGLGSIYRRTVTQADGTEREIPTWHIQFSVNGQQYRESTKTDNYNQAQKVLKRRITEITTGKFAGPSADRVLMQDLLKDVLADYELHDRKSLDTAARPLIEHHLLPAFGKMRAVNVKVPAITTYIKQRKADGAAVASINRELALLRRAFNLGVANQKLGPAQVPNFKGLLQREKNARQGFWEHHEYEAFRAALPVDERAMFVFGYWTGCRFGEIAALEWSQVDLAGRAVRLRDDQTKSGEARIIPLGGPGGDLYDMLVSQRARHQDLCPDSPWVFFRQGRAPGSYHKSVRRGQRVGDITKAWAAAVSTTGIRRLFHDLRRTGVRNLIRAGVPEKVAMLISGHKTRSVFERYPIVDERDLHQAAERLHAHVTGQGSGTNSTFPAQPLPTPSVNYLK